MTTATRTHHHNTAHGTYCYCSIGHDHANLPIENAHAIVLAMLRHQEIAITAGRRGVEIRKVSHATPNGWLTTAKRTLDSYGIAARPEVDRNQRTYLLVPLEAFNRR